MRQALLWVALLGATLSYAEVSAFNAGNVVSSSAYGLTQNEKLLKEKLDTLNGNFLQVNSSLDSTNERVEGLQSTLEGINSQYSETNTRLNEFEQNLNTLNEEFKKINAQLRATRNENKQIKQALSELTQLISASIGKDIMEQNATTPSFKDSNTTAVAKKDEPAWKRKESIEILNTALKEFEKKESIDSAKEKFEFLITRRYKPARANFYLGEIEYKQQNYSGAIVLYQKSVALYSKDTDYMAKLLYHTAISFDKVGDTARANGFYQALKAQYPQSAEAKAAPNRK